MVDTVSESAEGERVNEPIHHFLRRMEHDGFRDQLTAHQRIQLWRQRFREQYHARLVQALTEKVSSE